VIAGELACREVVFGSDDYRASVALRFAVLRQPFGLPWEPGAFDDEDVSIHLGCFAGEALVGTLVLRPVDDGALKMRQVAVAFERQRQGIGSLLVRRAEQVARERGYAVITAHARETAVDFYRRHGYEVLGEPFLDLGIPHREVRKRL
jgi:GNAT superfamily N-acetyltransferase